MSYQHTDIESDIDRDANRRTRTCRLERFSRNRYFNGKLMTARVMQAEQEYHAGRLETLAQHTVGEGVVCGLGTSVTADADGGVTVSLDPGTALDCCGRLVVVDGADKVPFPPQEVPANDFSLFLELDPCEAEKVTKSGSEDACGESCEYNRVIEDYTLRLEAGPPNERKPIPSVEFPSLAQKEAMAEAAPDDPPHVAKSIPARSFYAETDDSGRLHYDECSETGDPAVFLAYYKRVAGEWEHRPNQEPRHYAYSNDLLYSAIVSHATDLDNPHDAVTTVDGVDPQQDGNVPLVSDDGSIETSESASGGVSLELATALQDEIDALAEHVREDVLQYTIQGFYEVAERYADVDDSHARRVNEAARESIKTARQALAEHQYRTEAEFTTAVLRIASFELQLRRALEESLDQDSPQASEESFGAYDDAIGRLQNLLPAELFTELRNRGLASEGRGVVRARGPTRGNWLNWTREISSFELIRGPVGEGWRNWASGVSATELAVVQHQIVTAARRLERTKPETMVLPGGDTAVPARIIQGVINPGTAERTGFSPGDRVVDREANAKQTAIVIRDVDETADDWDVYGSETVADHNDVHSYVDEDDQVVLVVYERDLDQNWDYWDAADPEDLFYEVLTRGIKFYAFPEPRLQWEATT